MNISYQMLLPGKLVGFVGNHSYKQIKLYLLSINMEHHLSVRGLSARFMSPGKRGRKLAGEGVMNESGK